MIGEKGLWLLETVFVKPCRIYFVNICPTQERFPLINWTKPLTICAGEHKTWGKYKKKKKKIYLPTSIFRFLKIFRRQLRKAVVDHVSDSFLEPDTPLLMLLAAAREGHEKEVEEFGEIFTDHASKLVEVIFFLQFLPSYWFNFQLIFSFLGCKFGLLHV